MIKTITSANNPFIKQLVKLKLKKHRQKNKQFLVEGLHLIEEAYQADCLRAIITTNALSFANIDTYIVTEEIMKQLTDMNHHHPVVGLCDVPQSQMKIKKVLLLDGVQDPGNMGTLLRSAVAFGFETIVMDQCVDIYNAKVIRSTQGAIFKLNFIYCDIISFINDHPTIAFIATDLSADVYLSEFNIHAEQIGLILGNEGNGIRQEVSAASDYRVKINMLHTESLNVAVAGSICMYVLGGSQC